MILAKPALEIVYELAAISEAGENVGDRLVLRELEEPAILVEGHHESDYHEQDRDSGEHDRQ